MKRNCLSALICAVIAACFVCDPVVGVCDSLSGHGVGDVDCVKLSGYSGYQIAACRSNSYVKRKSGGKHTCDLFNTFRYCYYQCMLDLYGKTSGEIYKKCRCEGSTTPSTAEPITPLTVFPLCHSHETYKCKWFKHCLNRAFPSCDWDNKDTIRFLTEFCSLTKQKPNDLSSLGKLWLDDARKCVKRKLVPLLATDKQVKSCKDMKTTIMERYSQCYQELSSRFCDFSEEDRLSIFWHLVHDSSIHNVYENGLENIVDLIKECRDAAKDDALVQKLKVELEKKEREADIVPRVSKDLQIAELRIKAWLENPPVLPIQVDMILTKKSWLSVGDSSLNKQSLFAVKTVNELPSFELWRNKSREWFAFVVRDGKNSHIRLLFDDRCKCDNTSSCRADLGTILVRMSKSVLNTILNLKFDRSRFQIIKLTGCLDSNCTKHAFSVGGTSKCKTKNGADICGAADTIRSMRMLLFASFFLLVTNFVF